MTERILYCVFSRLLYLHFVTMLILDPTALCIFYPGGPTTTASPTLSAQQSSRVRGRRNTFVGLVLHSSLKNRKANVVLALSEIPGFQSCRPARGRKPSSSPSQFLSPSLRLRSLERFVRQSRKHIRILGHPQHDIGIETAQRLAPRASRLHKQEAG